MSERSGAVLLVLTDYADERCGVGTSEALLASLTSADVHPVDPLGGSFVAFARGLRRDLRGARGAIVAYPTVHAVERVALVPRLVLLRVLLGQRWLRVHLHEFEKLRRRHRIGAALLVGAIADKVVVSSGREARSLRTRYRGWAGRREVVVVPPANGSAPEGDPPREVVPGTVGVLGQHRPDKGEPWLLDVLRRLDPRYVRVELVGRGWDPSGWPAPLRERFDVVAHGQVPADELAKRVRSWDLAIAPYDYEPHDGRLSLRTPLAHGVPTVTRGPRPADLQLAAPHLLFDDEVDLGALPVIDGATRRAGVRAVAELELRWRAELVEELYGP